MATLVLGAVGTLVGGPLGGALGALAGRQIDGAIIGSPKREGPRLDELKVTTSSYGQPIERHVGRMRTAGTVIWATDLKEHGETSGGKGRPKTTTYSYSTSFAVALACHPIDAVGRIWADGNLLRGAAGDLKTGGQLRIHHGHGDQLPDPLMQAALGAQCPAFRGTAYLVFEDLQLADFGNRIPALSYEVFAGSGAATVGVLAREAGIAADLALVLPQIEGFTQMGEAPIQTLAFLDTVVPMVPVATPDGLRLDAPPPPETARELGPFADWDDGEFGAQGGVRSESAAPSPARFAGVRYYDVERDYLPGVQRAIARPERTGHDLIDLPIATFAEGARQLGRTIQRREDERRSRHFVRLAELDPSLMPGMRVRIPGRAGVWSVVAWEWREKGVELELHRLAFTQAQLPAPASQGLPWSPPDRGAGATLLEAFELPWDGYGAPDIGTVHAAVSASEGRWAGAALYAESGGALKSLGPSSSLRAIVGSLAEPLRGSPALMMETGAPLVLDLASEDMQLNSATMEAVALGANRLMLGEEVLQFVHAEQIGPRRWALTGLLRGRLGTEHAARDGHAVGARMALLDERILALDPQHTLSVDRIAAIGTAEDEPVYASIRARRSAAAPPSPVHPRVTMAADGTLSLAWTRRIQGGWRWNDGGEGPLIDKDELYEVGVGPVAAPKALWQTSTPSLAISGSERSALATSAPESVVWVRQVGPHARSVPLALTTLS